MILIVKFYKFVTFFLHYILLFIINIKVLLKKEKNIRWREKFCRYNISSSILHTIRGKNVIWFHAASAGEFNAIKSLLKQIHSSNRFILITTATSSGEKAFLDFKNQISNIHHVYVPYDTPQAIRRFINFWRPHALILVESEIWPNMILTLSEIAPICIINGRMSYKSFNKWKKFESILKYILSYCCFIGVNSSLDFKHYRTFFHNTILTGNLKYDAEMLYINRADLNLMQQSIANRKVFACISTHRGEDKILLGVYKKLQKMIPNLLMIIAPRYTEDVNIISQLCFDNKLLSVTRAHEKIINNHIPYDANIYICNTLGELGLIFSITKVIFMGGSFINIGGHNVCEPALFKCAIVTGEYTYNFKDLISSMVKAEGIIIVKNENELLLTMTELLNDDDKVATLGENAMNFVHCNKGALAKTLNLLQEYGII